MTTANTVHTFTPRGRDTLDRVETAEGTTNRLTRQSAVQWKRSEDADVPAVQVNLSETCQTIEGFGGAFTEASALTLQALPPSVQEELMRAYFDPEVGHGYTIGRMHMNSCDFAAGNYACCDTPGDFELNSFNIDRDKQAIIPMVRQAGELAGQPIEILVSPWSPPAWMKTTGQMNHGGKLKPECREAWARYYGKFIHAIEAEGVRVWGLTVQNEPAASQTWDSCLYSAEEERDFIRDYLGPALENDGLSERKLIIWDHNRDCMLERARVILSDKKASQYVWGTGFHWYGEDCFDNVQHVHDAWPDKHLVFTEGCQEGGPHHGSWDLGERYARSIINDLNRWTDAWIDWNLLLDHTGGPNHVGNLCSAPILADTRSGKLMYQSSYYYLGHFSRYIRPGAKRVRCTSDTDHILALAAINTDGTVAVVVLNLTDESRPFELRAGGRSARLTCKPRSIQTLWWKANLPGQGPVVCV